MPGLGFLAPWFLLGALAVAVPVVLHLFRREAAPLREFSAVRFVPQTPVAQSRQRRLSDVLLFLLRAAAVVALAVAFARPFVKAAVSAAGDHVTVVALDVSDSLSAPEVWTEAVRAAQAAVSAAPPGPVGVVAFDDEARVAIAPVADRAAVLAALQRVRAGAGATNFAAAFRAAADAFAGRRGSLVVVTDLQQYAVQEHGPFVAPPGVATRVRAVRPMTGNVSVSALGRDAGGLVAVVTNHGPAAWEGRAVARIDGASWSVPAALSIAPEATAEARFAGALPRTGVVDVTVDDGDGAQADNRRWMLLDPRAGDAIVVVGGADQARDGARFVVGALRAATQPDGEPAFEVQPKPTTAPELADPSWWRDRRAAVLLATRGLDRRARETLAEAIAGGLGVFVAAGPDVEGSVVRDLAGGTVGFADAAQETWPAGLALSDPRHPVLAALGPFAGRLGRVSVERGLRIESSGAAPVLRFTNGQPALVDQRIGRGRVLVFASDLGRRWGGFPLHPTFAPFLFEAVRYLGGVQDDPRERTPADLPHGARREAGPLAAANGTVHAVVNVDVREARVAFATEDAFTQRVQSAPSPTATEAGGFRASEQRLWRWMLAGLFALLIVESFVASRPRPAPG